MKYSWNRLSFVSSGWKVVNRCLPCRRATIVRGSLGSVSSSSRGPMDAGRRDEDIREMTWIGGSVSDCVRSMTTWFKELLNQRDRNWSHDQCAHWGSNEDAMEGAIGFAEALDFKWDFKRFHLSEIN